MFSSQLFSDTIFILYMKGKLLENAHTQIDQIRAGIAMKRAEMGTDLVDQLTPKEKELLSRLNPEITKLKEKLLVCTTSRVEVCGFIFLYDTFLVK